MSSRTLGVDRDRRRLLTLLALCPFAPSCEFANIVGTSTGQRTAAFTLDAPGFAALTDIGGMACVKVDIIDILLIRTSESEVLAFERFCPHQGLDMAGCDRNPTPADIDVESERIKCQHHGSTFDFTGRYVGGPASRDLQKFEVVFNASARRGAVILPGGEAPDAGLSVDADASTCSDSQDAADASTCEGQP